MRSLLKVFSHDVIDMMRIIVRFCACVALIWLPVSAYDIRSSYVKTLTNYGGSSGLSTISQQKVTSSGILCCGACMESNCVLYSWDPVTGICSLQHASQRIDRASKGNVNVMLGDPQNYPITSAKDCADIFTADDTSANGVYVINAGGRFIVPVHCNMNQDGFTTFLRRTTGALDFNRSRAEYMQGFGDVFGEHWLGLDLLHAITATGTTYEMRAVLLDWEGSSLLSTYASFAVGDEAQDYAVSLGAFVNGDGGDGLTQMNGMKFTTRDMDLDATDARNCAEYMNGGGWWYHSCASCTPTAKYYSGGNYTSDKNDGIQWRSSAAHNDMYYSMKRVTMQVKPLE